MSRIGNRVLTIPAGVTVEVNDNVVTVKGPKGELSLNLVNGLNVTDSINELVLSLGANL